MGRLSKAKDLLKMALQRQEGEKGWSENLDAVAQRTEEVPVTREVLPESVGDEAPLAPQPDVAPQAPVPPAPVGPVDGPVATQPSNPPLTPEQAERQIGAAGGAPPPREGPRGEAANFNYTRVRSEQDIESFLEEQFKIMDDAGEGLDVEAPRTSHESIEQGGRQVKWREITDAWKSKTPLTPEQMFKARKVELDLVVELQKDAEALKVKRNAGEASPEDEMRFREKAGKVAAISRYIAGEKRRAGQLLNSFKMVVEGSPLRGAARDEYLQTVANNPNHSLDDILDGVLGAKSVDDVVDAVDEPGLFGRIARIGGNVWFNAVLSKFAPVKATIGGLAFSKGIMPMETAMAAAVGGIRTTINKLGGKALPSTQAALNERVRMGEAVIEVGSIFTGLRDTAKPLLEAIKDPEYSMGRTMLERKDTTPTTLHSAFGDKNMGFNIATQVVDALTQNGSRRALAMADIMVKSLVGQQKVKALAYRIAVNEGLEGQALADRIVEVMRDMPDDVFNQTFMKTREATLTQKLAIPSFEKAVHWVNQTTGAKFFVPFLRTMLGAVELGLERIPMTAWISPRVREAWEMGGAARDEVIAKNVLGTSILMWGFSDGRDGETTSGWFLSKNEQQSLMASGWRPGTIVRDGDYHNINFVSPISDLYMLGAALGETHEYWTADYEHNDPRYKDPADQAIALAGAAIMVFVDSTLNKSVGQGMREFLEMIDDPARHGTYKAQRTAPPFATPAGSAILNRVAFDDTVRRVPDRGEGFQNTLMEVVDAWKKDIPGLSDDLPPMRDFFGNERKHVGYWEGVFGTSKSAKGVEAKILNEMQQNFVGARKPRKYYTTATGARINLDVDIPPDMFTDKYLDEHPNAGKRGYAYDRYSQIMGETMKEYLSEALKADGYKKLPIGEANNTDGLMTRGDYIDDRMREARVVARNVFEDEMRKATKRSRFNEMERRISNQNREEGFVAPAIREIKF